MAAKEKVGDGCLRCLPLSRLVECAISTGIAIMGKYDDMIAFVDSKPKVRTMTAHGQGLVM